MEKIISETKRKRIERNAAMIADYDDCMAKGSDKTAVYEYLAQKYGLKRAASVYAIIIQMKNPKRKKR